MNSNHTDDDLLNRAEITLRDLPADAGPSSATLQRITALAEVASEQPPVEAAPVATPRLARKIVLALVTSAALVLAIYTTVSSPTSSFAFEDVIAAVQKAKTLSYVTIITPHKAAASKLKTFHKGTRTRTEYPDGSYSVTDMAAMRMLMVQPKLKLASVTKLGSKPVEVPSMTDSIINWLRTAESTGKSVGEKDIDGVRATGFEAQFGAITMTLWGNPKTKLPVLIESQIGETAEPLQMTMRDFVFDAPVDDAQFSLDAPEGYKSEETVQPELDLAALAKMPPEEHVVRILKLYSDLYDGSFPERIDGPELIAKIMSKAGQVKGKDVKNEVTELAASIGAVWTYRQALNKFGYVGTAKRDDKDSIVFWYLPKDADQYRVVYADLTVGDVPAEKLPTVPVK